MSLVDDNPVQKQSLADLAILVTQVKANLAAVCSDINDLKRTCTCGGQAVETERLGDDVVLVSKKDLARLTQSIHSVKNTLPHVVNPDLVAAFRNQQALEDALSSVSLELQSVCSDRDHWRARCESVVDNLNQARKEQFEMGSRNQELTEQLSQQTDYCTSMGSACSTLLWRMSRSEDCVNTLLSGSKVEEFFKMITTTIDSYARMFASDSVSTLVEGEETKFVLALCGIITNIAASPFGREFLMTKDSGRQLIDELLVAIYSVPPKQCIRVKTLMLMAVYNISINQKGLKHLRSRPSLITQLAWILQGETDCECRLNVLRVIQSLLSDGETTSDVCLVHELVEVLSLEFVRSLAVDKCTDIKTIAVELLSVFEDAIVEK